MMRNEKIELYSGVELNLNKLIPSIKKRNWVELDFNVGGDAPKNFLAIYEYEKEGNVRRANVKSWPRYIAKVGHKWYPIESINEYLFNQLGEVLDLNMAFSRINMINGQLRFLSRYFLKSNESLVHGAEIFAGFISDKDFVEIVEQEGLSRRFFTFQFAKEAIEHMFIENAQQILEKFVKMLVFDAITGNNDRHFYNWGVIKEVRNKKSPTFAPIYDSARGLFWNDSEQKINNWYAHPKQLQDRLVKYAEGSRPKIGWEGLDELNHFDLVKKLYTCLEYKASISSMLDTRNLEKMKKLLNTRFNSYFTNSRLKLINDCLEYRFNRLSRIINE